MTLREIAVKAMQEIGLSEAQIASRLTFMDTAEPHCIERVQAQVPADKEQQLLEIAKGFFTKHNSIPNNN